MYYFEALKTENRFASERQCARWNLYKDSRGSRQPMRVMSLDVPLAAGT